MGVDPTNQAAFQARRKEVSSAFCLAQFRWFPTSPTDHGQLRRGVGSSAGVAHEFEDKYGWTKETADAVVKSYARNLRAGISLSTAGKRGGVTKGNHKRPLLRRPNGSNGRLNTDASANTRAAGVDNSNDSPSSHRDADPPSPPAYTTSNTSSSFPSSPLSRFAPLLPTTPPTVAQLSSLLRLPESASRYYPATGAEELWHPGYEIV